MNYNPVQASTRQQEHITSWHPIYLHKLLDEIDSDYNDDDELDDYVHLQDYTRANIDVYVQDENTDDQDDSF